MSKLVKGGAVPVDQLEIGLRRRYPYEVVDRAVVGPRSADAEIRPGLRDQHVGLRFDRARRTGVSGASIEAIVLYVHTGTDSTSRLIIYQDTGVTGLPLTPDGSDVQITVDAAGWFIL
jgi:hypothetical protein